MTSALETQPFPGRYRAGEARAARMGTLLRRIADVEEVDEDQMQRIGAALRRRDELGRDSIGLAWFSRDPL